MTNIILTLSQADIDHTIDTKDRDNYRIRRAARAVVTDTDGSIALLHARIRNYYKLPGGGVEDGEDIAQALTRELLEEVGASADVTQELGVVVEWRDEPKLKQVSYCFTAVMTSGRGTPTFTDSEIDEGFEVVWAPSLDRAIELVSASAHSDDIWVSFMAQRDTAILRTAAQRQLGQ